MICPGGLSDDAMMRGCDFAPLKQEEVSRGKDFGFRVSDFEEF